MKSTKRTKSFFQKHWIGCWVLLSILFAIIIHILFCIEAPNKYLIAHWGAGDILAYASTVALGLLAMWQNKRQEEENDKAQARLENISIRANELNIINKIIEHETKRIHSLQEVLDDFANACDPQTLALAAAKEGIQNLPSKTGLTELEKIVDRSFIEIARLLREDKEIRFHDKHPFNQAYAQLYIFTKDIIADFREEKIDLNDQSSIKTKADTLAHLRDNFMQEREQYLIQQEDKLSQALFENLSLEEIRIIYNTKSDS